MKQIYLKFSMLLLCLVVGLSSWAEDKTQEIILSTTDGIGAVTITTPGTNSTGSDYEFSQGNITVTGTKGYIVSGNKKLIVYKQGTMVVSTSEGKITKIDIEYNKSCFPFEELPGDLIAEGDNAGKTDGVQTKSLELSESATSVTFTNAAKGKTEVRSIKVYYTTSGDSPATTVTAPTFDVVAGSYTETQTVKVSNYDEDLLYFYTTDGTTPDCDENLNATGTSAEYDNDEGIEISSTTTLKMIAVDENGNKSSVTTATYNIKVPYTVTIETPEDGTLTVKCGGADVVSGSTYYAGDIISITATPDEGYKFRNIQVVDAQTHTFTASNTKAWTMGEASITIKANFDEIVYHEITWSVNDETSTTSVEDGAAIEFPSDLDDINGKKFVGWVSEEIDGATDTKPTFITSAKANGAVTYYAVFANAVEGSSETATLSCTTDAASTIYKQTTLTDNKGNTWNLYTNINKQTIDKISHYYFGLNKSDEGYNIASPIFPSTIISIKANVWNTNSSDTRYAYLCSSNETAKPTEGDLGGMTIAKSTKNQQQAFELVEDADFKQFYIYASAAIGFESIEVTYGTPTTYSAYCTSVLDYMAVTISEKCTDGTKYYSTFSTDQYFRVPADVTVSEVGLDEDGNLIVENYETDDIVEIGTGVMLSSATPGVKYIEVVSEYSAYLEGVAAALGDDNCLWGTLDEGVSADDMGYDQEDYQFYRLTMHNGSQIGFWWGAENGGPFNLGKNKAYLVVPKEGGQDDDGDYEIKMSYWFNNQETAITTPVAKAENGVIYNLNGQRVNTVTKGMYIKNGKKYFVK